MGVKLNNGTVWVADQTGGGSPPSGGGTGESIAPGKTSTITSNYYSDQAKMALVKSDSFVADRVNPVMDIEINCSSSGISHMLFELYVGPGVTPPLHDGTVGSAVSGVTRYQVGSIAGEIDRGEVHRRIELSGITIGATVNWELRVGVVGYSNQINVTDPTKLVIAPDNESGFILTATTAVAVGLARNLTDFWDTTQAADNFPAVPALFTTIHDGVITPDGKYLYVVDWFGSSVSCVDIQSNRVIAKLTAAAFLPTCCAIKADGTILYVGDADTTGQIQEISVPGNVLGTTHNMPSAGYGPFFLSLSPDGTKLAVACLVSAAPTRLVIFDTSSWSVLHNLNAHATGQTCGQPAWESNTVLWYPITDADQVRRFDTVAGTFSSNNISIDAPTACATDAGTGTADILFVSANGTGPHFAYYTLPSTSGAVPPLYDSNSAGPFDSIALSSDSFIYLSSQSADKIMVLQGGAVYINASQENFFGDRVTVKVYGGH